jgi:multidrug efflux pump subunit AcrA (membrane-fusion protein)
LRGKWVWISVLAVVLGIGGAALSSRRRKPMKDPRSQAAAVLQADQMITLTGNIRPQHVVGVGASVPGNIDAFLADVGDEVYTGQVLARIGEAGLETNRDAASSAVEAAQQLVGRAETALNSARLEASRSDADLQRSKLQMEAAQKLYERQRTLHKSGATPRIVFEKAEKEYEAAVNEFDIMDKGARAGRENVQTAQDQLTAAKRLLASKSQELEDAQAAYQAAELRAPVEGTVVGRKGEVGKPALESGDQLFQIATDLYTLEVPLDADVNVLKRLRPGDPATVLVLDMQSAGMAGVVKSVTDTQVIVEFNNMLTGIKPGMRADVRLKLE